MGDMSMNNNKLENIVIVGGGTAGWMAAACLAKVLKNSACKITLVESPEISTIGVGEATIPPIVDFIRMLEIDERDFIQKTQATFKLAIQFQDWRRVGESYWHQFGTVGTNIDGLPFYQHWLKSTLNGNTADFTDYAPSIAMAKWGKFVIVPEHERSILAGSKYAWHFDATLVAKYLSSYSIQNAVTHIQSHVETVELNSEGFIASICLSHGNKIAGDFFIDCTGFKGLLIEGALATGYEDWSHFLPCNSAIVAQTQNAGLVAPYTQSKALDAGWQWRIPLQHRTGNGYVFCNDFTNIEHAEAQFRKSLEGKLLTEPRILNFTTGKRKKIWNKNCLALGLAAGFLEPLESTSIHLIVKAIVKFTQMLPLKEHQEPLLDEYNRIISAEYECIRDFIVLHYCTTERDDSAFWRYCKNMAIPDSLKLKLNLFKCQGRLYKNEFDLFTDNSWYAVLNGMGVRPNGYDPLIDMSDQSEVMKILTSGLHSLEDVVQKLPAHDAFIKENCPAFY
jgi:tryptophan halogenase